MAKKKDFWQGVGNVTANTGLALGDTVLSTFGATDVVKDKHYKGSTADEFATAGNIGGAITKTAAPVAAGVLGATVGIPPSVSMAAMSGIQQGVGGTVNKNELAKIQKDEQAKIAKENQPTAFMQEPPKTNSLGSYVAYEKGGQPKSTVVNIEKDELEVNPKTGEIVKDFRNKPEHPKGKDIINLKGNVQVSTENVIIPAKYRDKYLSGNEMVRKEIIHEVLEDQAEREGMSLKKMANGGLPIMETQLDTMEEFNPTFNAKGTDAKSTQTGGGMGNVDSGTIAGAASAIPGMVYGIQQTRESKKALEELQKKPMARYSLGEQQAALGRATELENAARGRARMGFTPEEKAQYEQSVARQNQTLMANAAKIGGAQGAQVMSAMGRAANTNALLDFASRNAQMQRQNQAQADQASRYTNQMLGQLAAQKNLQTGTDIQARLMQERALGQALSQGRQNVTNSLGQLAGYGAMAGAQAMGAQAPAPQGISAEQLQQALTS